MLILPLKFIREEDKNLVGINIYNLSKLKNLGIPVVESAVAIPPIDLFKNTLQKFKKHTTNLKDHLYNLRNSVLNLNISDSFKDFLLHNFPHSGKDVKVDVKKLLDNLLQKWADELISKIERGEQKLLEFTPQLIILSANFSGIGKGYFDEDRNHVVIKTDKGNLNFKLSEEIENIIISGNKKLILPQIYYWVIENGKINIIKVAPFTQSIEAEIDITPQIKNKITENTVKTATRIFLDLKDEESLNISFDGVILRLEDIAIDSVDKKISKIIELNPDLKIFFYPEFKSDLPKNLKFAETFLFFRNKKKLDVSIVLPNTFSVDEFIKLKTDFASIGVYSKGSLKIWKEFTTVGDFLNMEDYIEGGFDGALINLDAIVKLVTGVHPEMFLKEARIDWTGSLIKFFKELGFSKLLKESKQVIVFGNSIQNEELLNYFIKIGIWGIVLEKNILEALKGHISFIEKQTVKKLNLT